MIRPIDGDALMELFKEQYVHCKTTGNKQRAQGWQGAMQLLYDAPTLVPQSETPPCYQPDGDGCAYQCYDGQDEPIEKCKECPLCYSDKKRRLAKPDEPLTIEQLRKMDGEPVYVVSAIGERPEWYIVDREERELKNPWDSISLENWDAGYPYTAYCRPPEGRGG